MESKDIRHGLGYLVTVPVVIIACVAALIAGMFVFGVTFNLFRTLLVMGWEAFADSL